MPGTGVLYAETSFGNKRLLVVPGTGVLYAKTSLGNRRLLAVPETGVLYAETSLGEQETSVTVTGVLQLRPVLGPEK